MRWTVLTLTPCVAGNHAHARTILPAQIMRIARFDRHPGLTAM
jgi:hypothetical protein